jgi:hypothetical protein
MHPLSPRSAVQYVIFNCLNVPENSYLDNRLMNDRPSTKRPRWKSLPSRMAVPQHILHQSSSRKWRLTFLSCNLYRILAIEHLYVILVTTLLSMNADTLTGHTGQPCRSLRPFNFAVSLIISSSVHTSSAIHFLTSLCETHCNQIPASRRDHFTQTSLTSQTQ